jgi:hypothetical protein
MHRQKQSCAIKLAHKQLAIITNRKLVANERLSANSALCGAENAATSLAVSHEFWDFLIV